MPVKKTKKPRKTYKSKTYKKKSNAVSGPFMLINKYVPFKSSYNALMRYTYTYQLTSGLANTYGTEIIFRLNSLYDPDFALGGHQPYGFDQMATLYNKYKVNSFDLELEIYDPDADGMIVAAQMQSSNAATTITGKAVDAIKEQPMSITRILNNTGSQKVIVKQKNMKIATIEGISPKMFAYQLENYAAVVTNDPANVPYLRIAAANVGLASKTVYVRTTIVYHSLFYDRNILSQS